MRDLALRYFSFIRRAPILSRHYSGLASPVCRLRRSSALRRCCSAPGRCFPALPGCGDVRTTDAALTGSALYALMPYVAVLNPQVRLAFAECAAAAFVPLVFAAIDVARGRAMMSVVLVAPAICALTAVHLPTTVLVGGLACVYSALAGETWLDRGSRTVATAAAVALGLGIAGWLLLPALGLLGTISAAALSDAAHSPENHFLLWQNAFRHAHGPLQGLLLDFSLIVPVAMSLLFGRTALRTHRTSRPLLGSILGSRSANAAAIGAVVDFAFADAGGSVPLAPAFTYLAIRIGAGGDRAAELQHDLASRLACCRLYRSAGEHRCRRLVRGQYEPGRSAH